MINLNQKQIVMAIDQLVNTFFGGWADETISARAHRETWKLEWYIDLLFCWHRDKDGNRNHCVASFEHEKMRLDSPEEYRKCFECEE